MGVRVQVDRAKLARVREGLAAVAATLAQGWEGYITVGPRTPMLPFESVPPAHGRDVVASLAARGRDPMDVPSHVAAGAQIHIRQAYRVAVQRARRSGREQSALIRSGVDRATRECLAFVQHRLRTGGLRRNSPSWSRFKVWAIRRGWISAQYGVPPPYGIFSGRLLRALGIQVRRGPGAPRGVVRVARFIPRRVGVR